MVDPLQLQRARLRWYFRDYKDRNSDNDILPYLQLRASGTWLAKARSALLLSVHGIARRMGVTQAAYREMERAEQEGNLSLGDLRKCAEAMGCELIYAIRPKKRTVFSQVVWRAIADEIAAVQPDRVALDALIKAKLADPRFRRKHGWQAEISPIVVANQ